MSQVHQIKINTRDGIFKLDEIPIMDQAVACTIHYRGNAPAVVELTLLADVDLEDRLPVQVKSTGERSRK